MKRYSIFRHVRWHGTLSQITALFSHCVPAMPGPHRGHLRPGHGAISMPHLPGAHHNPAGRGVGIAALVSCQPTPGLDGSAAPWGHSQVFHPSNPGKEKIRLGNPLTFKVIRYFNLMIDPFVITYKRKHKKIQKIEKPLKVQPSVFVSDSLA